MINDDISFSKKIRVKMTFILPPLKQKKTKKTKKWKIKGCLT